jgi:hypothetical protein
MIVRNQPTIFTVIVLALLLFAARKALAEEDIYSWDSVMAQKWETPAKLDEFVGVHPRYLLNARRISDLKRKVNTTHKQLWQMIKEMAESYKGKVPPSDYNKQGPMRTAARGMPYMALAYLISGESEHLTNAQEWVLSVCSYPTWDGDRSLGAGECLFAVSLCYDWLYHKFTEEQRACIKEKLAYQAEQMKRRPQHHDRWLANHNHVENCGLAAAGFVLYDEEPKAYDWLKQTGLGFRQTFELLGPDGASDEGQQYWAYSTESLLSYAEAARDLMGIDYYRNSDFMKNALYYVIYSNLPDLRADDYAMMYGDAQRGYAARNPIYILYRLASEYNNGYAQWTANAMVESGIGKGEYRNWCSLIWCDDKVETQPIRELPLFRHFDNIGWITCRSDWGPGAVMVGFRCGPFHGHKLQPYYDKMTDLGWQFQKLGGGHCHPDINSFQIYAYGKWLTIDPGYEKPKKTSSHSTVLVNGIGQLGEAGITGRDYDWFDCEAVVAEKAKSKIIKTETNPLYDYIVGDAGNIYPASSGLETFLRHLIFIRPDIVVVVDELKAARPAQFEWRLHMENGVVEIARHYYLVSNGEVVMDTHIIYPDDLDERIDGNFLVVCPQKTAKTIIVTVFNPRRMKDMPSKAKIHSVKDGEISLNITTASKKINVRVDIENRKVELQ